MRACWPSAIGYAKAPDGFNRLEARCAGLLSTAPCPRYESRRRSRHFLLTLDDLKPLDLKALAEQVGVSKLSLASVERLKARLGVEPDAVSLMALVNDAEHAVEVLMDRDLWDADALHCHPLANTATLVIGLPDLKKFLAATGHAVRLVEIAPAGAARVDP